MNFVQSWVIYRSPDSSKRKVLDPTFLEYGPCVTNFNDIAPGPTMFTPYVPLHVAASIPSYAQFCVHVAAFGQID